MSEIKYNAKQFSALLFIYAANADMDFSDSEKIKIKELVGDHIYQKMTKEYESMSAEALFTIINDYKGIYFPTADRKQELIHRLIELFEADGDFSEMERGLMKVLEKLI